jgi:hypothetical protein
MSSWSQMAATMNSNKFLAGLRPSEKIDLGTYGTDTFDASQYEDAERLGKKLDKLAKSVSERLADDGLRVFEQTRTPAEALQLEFRRLNTLLKEGAIGWDIYERAVTNAQNEFTGVTDAIDSVSESMGSAFEGMVIDGENWRDAMSKLLKDVAREILRVAAITPLMNAIKGGVGGMFGGGGTNVGLHDWGIGTSVAAFANGGAFRVGGSGGIDSQMVAFRASPNERVSVTKPDQERGSSVPPIVINADLRGADASAVAGITAKLGQLERSIPEIVRQTNKGDRVMRPGVIR